MAAINRDLEKLQELGYKNVFIDEVTLMEDFIDSAALFSDIYAAQGMKIVLSGTDSLGFWFALHQELYDRAVTIHTTFIPFREHSRLLGIHSIDEYIRYGGTLRAGELDFDNEDVNAEDASFRDDESTRRYIDTAICKNIQHSLSCCQDGGYFRHLQSLYDAGELTGAINRIIEDMNHRFLIRTLILKFKSHDLVTFKSSKKNKRVFKLTFSVGEYDMAIYDPKENTCECYEIKHNNQIVSTQTKYLMDEEKLNQTSKRFGNISKRCVLYRGEDTVLENGIEYQNVEEYLKKL